MGITSIPTGEIPSILVSDTLIHTVLATIITRISTILSCTILSIILTDIHTTTMVASTIRGIADGIPGILQLITVPIIHTIHGIHIFRQSGTAITDQ